MAQPLSKSQKADSYHQILFHMFITFVPLLQNSREDFPIFIAFISQFRVFFQSPLHNPHHLILASKVILL